MGREAMGQLMLSQATILGVDLHVWLPIAVGLLVLGFVYYITRR
jgi:hypothetical protein